MPLSTGSTPAPYPPDALTASASGLDPDISEAYAEIQIARVARARGLAEDEVRKLVAENTHTGALGYIGQTVVNVVDLNLALNQEPR